MLLGSNDDRDTFVNSFMAALNKHNQIPDSVALVPERSRSGEVLNSSSPIAEPTELAMKVPDVIGDNQVADKDAHLDKEFSNYDVSQESSCSSTPLMLQMATECSSMENTGSLVKSQSEQSLHGEIVSNKEGDSKITLNNDDSPSGPTKLKMKVPHKIVSKCSKSAASKQKSHSYRSLKVLSTKPKKASSIKRCTKPSAKRIKSNKRKSFPSEVGPTKLEMKVPSKIVLERRELAAVKKFFSTQKLPGHLMLPKNVASNLQNTESSVRQPTKQVSYKNNIVSNNIESIMEAQSKKLEELSSKIQNLEIRVEKEVELRKKGELAARSKKNALKEKQLIVFGVGVIYLMWLWRN